MKNLFFIDFETTGLNPYHNETIEVGIQKYGINEYYNTLITPKEENGIYYKYVPQKITAITGITDEDIIKGGISQEDAIFNTYKYIEDNSEEGPIYIIAHNGLSFDFIFFRKMIDNYNTGNVKTRNTSIKDSILKRFMYIDTLLLARYLIPNDRVNQPSLCKRFNIKNTDEHRSMGDVKSLIEIYITICEQLSYTKKHSNKNYYLENTEKVLEELFI
jgi:DNA polymerase III epsilon subunit-like protein